MEEIVKKSRQHLFFGLFYDPFDYSIHCNSDDEKFDFLTLFQTSEIGLDHFCTDCRKERMFKPEKIRGVSPFGLAASKVEQQDQREESLRQQIKKVGTNRNKQSTDALSFQLLKLQEGRRNVVEGNYGFQMTFSCSYDPAHQLSFAIRHSEGNLIKFGQYPSIADNSKSNLKKYKKVLPEAEFAELNRAYGLQAVDVSIGAFVYLRRVFERLVDRAEKQALDKKAIKEPLTGTKVIEKIKILKDYLPEAMVAHSKLYSILSKGIHELNEKDCREAFEAISQGIEMILDELLAKKLVSDSRADKGKKIEALAKKLANKGNPAG